jgi:hypothetical protein
LTPTQRAEAEQVQRELTAATTARDDEATRKGRFAIITDLLLSKPIPGASTEVGRARGGAYRDALDDVPPWAIAAVVRKWRRGECGEDRNYTWAPDEALLRKLALAELAPLRAALDHVSGLLAATSLDEAMKSAEQQAADREYVSTGFAKLKGDLTTGPRAPEQAPAA